MKLTYHRNGDYLFPVLGLTEAEQCPLGKYGRMRLRYLEGTSSKTVHAATALRQAHGTLAGNRPYLPGAIGADGLPDAGVGRCDRSTESGESDGMGTAHERHPPSDRGDSPNETGFRLKGEILCF